MAPPRPSPRSSPPPPAPVIAAPAAPVQPLETAPTCLALEPPAIEASRAAVPPPPPVAFASPVVVKPAAPPLAAAAITPASPSIADAVEIEIDDALVAAPPPVPAPRVPAPPVAAPPAPPAPPARGPMFTMSDGAPSKETILERAAALGPMRMTWASILPTSDPILEEKQTPRIAERRARLTKVVKGTVAACGGLCLVAAIVSIFSAGEPSANAATASTAAAIKTAPSERVVTIEQLDVQKRGKVERRAATAAFVRWKRR